MHHFLNILSSSTRGHERSMGVGLGTHCFAEGLIRLLVFPTSLVLLG
jgi:hypothetical protein